MSLKLEDESAQQGARVPLQGVSILNSSFNMPLIEVVSLEKATGFLKKEYEAAIKRAGRIWNIVSIMSLNAHAMKSSMGFYSAIMFGRSPLSRSQREMLAVVVSAANHCVY